ncbi:MAG: hypothetical protein IKV75_05750, partial [Bacteroidales bacterium]|nr:hypothetical protein [Bacteroidales bacterium]
ELDFDVTDEDASYNAGWQAGWDESVRSEIPKIYPKLKGSDPDYWDKLLHQYAGMAMQGMLSNAIGFDEVRKQAAESGIDNLITLIAGAAMDYATALVEKLKEERK